MYKTIKIQNILIKSHSIFFCVWYKFNKEGVTITADQSYHSTIALYFFIFFCSTYIHTNKKPIQYSHFENDLSPSVYMSIDHM